MNNDHNLSGLKLNIGKLFVPLLVKAYFHTYVFSYDDNLYISDLIREGIHLKSNVKHVMPC